MAEVGRWDRYVDFSYKKPFKPVINYQKFIWLTYLISTSNKSKYITYMLDRCYSTLRI